MPTADATDAQEELLMKPKDAGPMTMKEFV
jgi:hypothetical protein